MLCENVVQYAVFQLTEQEHGGFHSYATPRCRINYHSTGRIHAVAAAAILQLTSAVATTRPPVS